jgi:hypothetical protein
MSRRYWLYSLVLVCAILVVGSLALLTRSTLAESVLGSPGKSLLATQNGLNTRFNPAFVEMGGPLGQSKLAEPGSKLPSGTGTGNGSHAGGSTQQPASSCWSFVPTPDLGSGFSQLYGVSSNSPKDVWASGWYCSSGCNTVNEVDSTLTEHWNGTVWSFVPTPDLGSNNSILNAVKAFSPGNAWATGDYWNGSRFLTLSLHWDGSAWNVVPSPNPGGANNYLDSIAALNPNDIWVVGTYRIVGGPLATLVEHWNGSAWSVVPSPYPGTGRNILNSVAALSPNNVWAVGLACDDNNCQDNPRTLIEHWDGSSWSVVSNPNPSTYMTALDGVSASTPDDIWAVGFYCAASDCSDGGLLIEHYNGTAWSIVSGPVSNPFSAYWGVYAVNSKDVYIAGSYSTDGNSWTNLLSHWDGTSWSVIPLTSPGAFDNDLRSITAIGPNNIWVAGDYDNGDGERTQVQHYDGPCRDSGY